MKTTSFFIKKQENIYHLFIKLTPNAKFNKIGGIFCNENGQDYLCIYTTVIPENNKANKELIKIISKDYKVPKSNIKLIKGHKSRYKLLEVISLI